jgi:hypothetical protein
VNLVDFLWTLLVIFFMVIYFMIMFRVIIDVFRRDDISGVGKAGWLLLLLVLPLITLLIYTIAQGKGMAERDMAQYQQMRSQQDSYIREVAGGTDPAAQIKQAHDLLQSGAISQEEFDNLKAKALAS